MSPKTEYLRAQIRGWLTVVVFFGVTAGVLLGLMAQNPGETPADDRGLPVGTITAFAGRPATVPEQDGWLLCDGRELSIQDYGRLFATLQFAWGKGSREGTFRVPDLRGRFLRGVDLTGVEDVRDPDRDNRLPANPGGNAGNQVGSVQSDAFALHSHSLVGATRATGFSDAGQWIRFYGSRIAEENAPDTVSETAIVGAGGSETRPKNAFVHWIIKAR